MEKATIVTLAPRTTQPASFEEAFGEFSEFKGRGRDRRAKKKSEKIQRKKKKKLEKIEAKREIKRARQDMRDEMAERRGERGVAKKGFKVKRKAFGKEAREMSMDDQTSVENGEMGGYENPDYANESYQESPEPYEEPAEGEYEGEGGGYEGDDYEGDTIYEEEDGDFIGEDESMGADGVKTKMKIVVSKEAQDLADKIEWNKEFVSRLRRQIAINRGKNADNTGLMKQVDERLNRIAELTDAMKAYSKFEGQYSCADGVSDEARKNRMSEVKYAFKKAKGKLMSVKNKRKMNHGGSETPVEADLNPEFSRDKIVIPSAEPGSNMTGLNGIDLVDDADAPPVTEITLSAEGKAGINWKGIAIGTGIGIAAIIALKKFKVF